MKKKKVFENEDKPVESLEKTANSWTFLTNHTHVLLCLYRNPDSTLREVAGLVGITERMVQKVVAELLADGFILVNKIGRRNSYKIRTGMRLRHPLESHRQIGELLAHLAQDRGK